tara:strand:+ start:666 stop:860 length:195 start_codon:yes stop_codon:yes gene_type:complete
MKKVFVSDSTTEEFDEKVYIGSLEEIINANNLNKKEVKVIDQLDINEKCTLPKNVDFTTITRLK